MSNYRPKSLNELNNLYDRSQAAQSAIQQSGSEIEENEAKDDVKTSVQQQEIPAVKEKTAAQIASDELSEQLDKFIKSFGEVSKEETEPAVAVPTVPVPIKTTVKSAPAKPKTSKASGESEDKKVVQRVNAQSTAKKEEKPKTDEARNQERDELFNDYLRIMNDEDEEKTSLKTKFRKKSKSEKHQASPLDDDDDGFLEILEKEEQTVYSDEEPEQEAQEAVKEEKKERPKKEKVKKEKVRKEKAAPKEKEKEEPTLIFEEYENVPEKKKKSKKHIFAQILLIASLLTVLCLTVVVGAAKIIVGVDSGKVFLGKYCVFTADVSSVDAGISAGELVITENRHAEENEAVAFVDIRTNSVSFGTRGSEIDGISYMVHSDSGVVLVPVTSVKGVVVSKIPVLGGIVGTVMDNFIIVIILLVVLALILILILALAFKSSSNYDDELFEQEDEDFDILEIEEDGDDGYDDYDDDDEYYDDQQELYGYDDNEYEYEDEEDYEDDDSLFSTID